jgi:hypothetical protein
MFNELFVLEIVFWRFIVTLEILSIELSWDFGWWAQGFSD